MDHLSEQELSLHVTILGWVHIVGSCFMLLLGILVFMLLVGIGATSGDNEGMRVLTVIGVIVLLFLGALALPGIAAGLGLLRRQPWGRVLALVVGFLGLINFPIGTAIGAYTFWVLLQRSATDYFAPQGPAIG